MSSTDELPDDNSFYSELAQDLGGLKVEEVVDALISITKYLSQEAHDQTDLDIYNVYLYQCALKEKKIPKKLTKDEFDALLGLLRTYHIGKFARSAPVIIPNPFVNTVKLLSQQEEILLDLCDRGLASYEVTEGNSSRLKVAISPAGAKLIGFILV